MYLVHLVILTMSEEVSSRHLDARTPLPRHISCHPRHISPRHISHCHISCCPPGHISHSEAFPNFSHLGHTFLDIVNCGVVTTNSKLELSSRHLAARTPLAPSHLSLSHLLLARHISHSEAFRNFSLLTYFLGHFLRRCDYKFRIGTRCQDPAARHISHSESFQILQYLELH